jgi:hypothetical protein
MSPRDPAIYKDGIKYVPVKVAAKNVGLVPDYVSRMCRTKTILAIRHAGIWHVEEESLTEFLRKQSMEYEEFKRRKSLVGKVERQKQQPKFDFKIPALITKNATVLLPIIAVLFLLPLQMNSQRQFAAAGSPSMWDRMASSVFFTLCPIFKDCPEPIAPTIQTQTQVVAVSSPTPVPAPTPLPLPPAPEPKIAVVTSPAPAQQVIQPVRSGNITNPIRERVIEKVVPSSEVAFTGVTLTQLNDLETRLNAKIHDQSVAYSQDTSKIYQSFSAPSSGGGGGSVTNVNGVTTFVALTDVPSSLAAGDILFANIVDHLSALPAGANGMVLKLAGGFPTWAPDMTGSGGSSAWATTTDSLAVYTGDPTQVVLVGNNATTTTGNILEVKGNTLLRGTLTIYSTVTAPQYVATSTLASVFPYASSTAITAGNLFASNFTNTGNATLGNATSTSFAISNIPSGSLLKAVTGGSLAAAIAGTDYLTSANLFAYPFPGDSTSTPLNFNGGFTASASTFTGNTALANATTTTFAISSLSNSLLKVNANGSVIPAIAGTDYLSSTFAYLFPNNSTSTLLTFSSGFLGLGSSTIGNGSQTGGLTINGGATTTGNAYFGSNIGIGTSSRSSVAVLIDRGIVNDPSNGIQIGSNPLNNLYQFGAGLKTDNSFSIGGNAIIPTITDSNSGNSWINLTATGLHLGQNNNSVGLDVVTASGKVGIGTTSPSTLLSLAGISGIYASTTATSTFQGGGINLVTAAGNTGCFAINGVCITSGSGLSLGYPFPLAGNATSTLAQFNGGLTAFASSTIGNGSQANGLTIFGGATTTGNAYFSSQILAADGSAPTPSIAFNSSPTKGFYLANSEVSFADQSVWSANFDGAAITVPNTHVFGFASAQNQAQTTGISRLANGKVAIGNGTSGDVSGTLISSSIGVGTSSPWAQLSIHANNGSTNTTLFAIGSSTSNSTTTLFSISNTGAITDTSSGSHVFSGSIIAQSGIFAGPSAVSDNSGQIQVFDGSSARKVALNTAGAELAAGTALYFNNNTSIPFGVSDTVLGRSAANTLKLSSDGSNGTAHLFVTGTASSTNLVISSAGGAGTRCLQVGADGTVSANASACGSGSSAYPFPLTDNATSTLTQFNGGITAYASSTIGNGTQIGGLTINGGATTTGNFLIQNSNPQLSVRGTNNSGTITIQNSSPSNLLYLQTDSSAYGTLGSYTQLTIDADQGGNAAPLIFKLGNTERARFAPTTGNFGIGTSSPTSLLSFSGNTGIYASTTATSTFQGSGINLVTAAGNTGCFAVNGVCITSGSSFGYLFPNNSTSTLLNFNGGLTAYASSTIGNGTQIGGLTINGGATTTGNAYFGGNIAIAGNNAITFGGNGTVRSTSGVLDLSDGNQNAELTSTQFNMGITSGRSVTNTLSVTPFSSNTSDLGSAALQYRNLYINTIGVASSSPWAKLSIHANNGDTNTTLFAIGSSTSNSTTTLFSISNTGNTTAAGNVTASGNVSAASGLYSKGGVLDLSSGSDGTIGLVTSGNGTLQLNANGGTAGAALYFGSAFNVRGDSGSFGFTQTGFDVLNAADAAFSHLGPAKIAVGNGTVGDTSGTLILNTIGLGTSSPSTLLSLAGTSGIYASTTATSTFQGGGINLITAAGNTGCFAINGTCLTSGSSFGYLFPNNSTSTLLNFSGGITAYASSTIGNGTQIGGLTINGGATTTGNQYIGGSFDIGTGLHANASGNVGIYVNNPIFALDVLGSAEVTNNFHFTGTASHSLDSRSANAPISIVLWNGSTNVTAATFNQTGNVGVGTSSPFARISIHANANDATPATTLFAIGSSTASATSTLFSISNTGSTTLFQLPSSLLKTDSNGTIVAAVAGTDYLTSASIAANDPFTHPAAGQSATTSLMLFSGAASSTMFSAYNGAFFGGTATSSFNNIGQLDIASTNQQSTSTLITWGWSLTFECIVIGIRWQSLLGSR